MPDASRRDSEWPMWIDRVVSVGEKRLTLSVHLLADAERDAVAAAIAWLAATSAQPGDALNGATWKVFIEDVLGPHVNFKIEDQAPGRLTGQWWDEAIRLAAGEFIRANSLDGLVRRYLPSIEAQSSLNGAMS